MVKHVVGVGIAAATFVMVGACFDYASDCSYTLQCRRATGGSASTSTSGSTSSMLGSGASTSSATISTSSSSSSGAPICDPSKTAAAVDDSCGVFVSVTGDDTAAGTKEKPLKTLTVAVSKGATVYACAGASPFSEALTVTAPLALYGALDCTTWKHDAATKTQLTAPSDAVPLTLAAGAAGSAVHDFAITAADATMPGGSSIAVLDNGAALTLENVDVTAGAGAAGAPGAAQAQVMTPSSAKGTDGTDDATCNLAGPIAGGGGGKNMCAGVDVGGGGGGNGFAATSGGDGQSGQPTTQANQGKGQTATVACTSGNAGAAGMVGTLGTGARGIGILGASGLQAPAAMAGGTATPGEGGGGGGGARQCDTGNFAGPSGGGGGAGGCGGNGGNAGQSGGSSIGILSVGGALNLTSVNITTKAGGAGGLGGDGQLGGNGGLAGHALGGAACDGAKGGQGGAGGPGGGGAGGHSIALAIQGTALPSLANATLTHAMAGSGALGGNMDMTAQTKGDSGLACTTLDFAAGASSCKP